MSVKAPRVPKSFAGFRRCCSSILRAANATRFDEAIGLLDEIDYEGGELRTIFQEWENLQHEREENESEGIDYSNAGLFFDDFEGYFHDALICFLDEVYGFQKVVKKDIDLVRDAIYDLIDRGYASRR